MRALALDGFTIVCEQQRLTYKFVRLRRSLHTTCRLAYLIVNTLV